MVNRPPAPRPTPPNALSVEERRQVLDLLHEPENCDLAVAQVWTRTLDEGSYLCSQSTMHRILRARGESQDRRGQRTHPATKIPELMAEGPNRVWSWDITKLKGPRKGIHYNLYVVLDIFSRYVPNWILAEHEDQDLAKDFLNDAIVTQGIDEHQLTIHADRGGAMLRAGESIDAGPAHPSEPLTSPRVERQPLLRSAVQDAQVLPSLSRAFRLH